MQNGDFIRMDFTGRLQTGELFDTTDEVTAKKENAFNPKQKYKPVLVILGSGMVVPGVEANLMHMKPGEEKEFDLTPAEGYGARNPTMIRIISLAKFMKDKINPVPGTFVNIDGMDAKIQSVSGGRVRVDFNHPLSGRSLKYRVKVVQKIDTTKDKADVLFEHYGFKGESTLHESVLEMRTDKPAPEFVQQIFSMSLKKWVPDIKEVKFSVKGDKSHDKAHEKAHEIHAKAQSAQEAHAKAGKGQDDTHANKKATDASQLKSDEETVSSDADSDEISRPDE